MKAPGYIGFDSCKYFFFFYKDFNGKTGSLKNQQCKYNCI